MSDIGSILSFKLKQTVLSLYFRFCYWEVTGYKVVKFLVFGASFFPFRCQIAAKTRLKPWPTLNRTATISTTLLLMCLLPLVKHPLVLYFPLRVCLSNTVRVESHRWFSAVNFVVFFFLFTPTTSTVRGQCGPIDCSHTGVQIEQLYSIHCSAKRFQLVFSLQPRRGLQVAFPHPPTLATPSHSQQPAWLVQLVEM